jgi:hypothetical protein
MYISKSNRTGKLGKLKKRNPHTQVSSERSCGNGETGTYTDHLFRFWLVFLFSFYP